MKMILRSTVRLLNALLKMCSKIFTYGKSKHGQKNTGQVGAAPVPCSYTAAVIGAKNSRRVFSAHSTFFRENTEKPPALQKRPKRDLG